MTEQKEELVWTSRIPTENGWYWHRFDHESLPQVLEVRDGVIYERVYIDCTGENLGIEKHRESYGHWCGPLSVPVEKG